MISEEGGQWVLRTRDGSRVLGRHPTRDAAVAQERAILSAQRARAMEKAAISLRPFLGLLRGLGWRSAAAPAERALVRSIERTAPAPIVERTLGLGTARTVPATIPEVPAVTATEPFVTRAVPSAFPASQNIPTVASPAGLPQTLPYTGPYPELHHYGTYIFGPNAPGMIEDYISHIVAGTRLSPATQLAIDESSKRLIRETGELIRAGDPDAILRALMAEERALPTDVLDAVTGLRSRFKFSSLGPRTLLDIAPFFLTKLAENIKTEGSISSVPVAEADIAAIYHPSLPERERLALLERYHRARARGGALPLSRRAALAGGLTGSLVGGGLGWHFGKHEAFPAAAGGLGGAALGAALGALYDRWRRRKSQEITELEEGQRRRRLLHELRLARAKAEDMALGPASALTDAAAMSLLAGPAAGAGAGALTLGLHYGLEKRRRQRAEELLRGGR